MKELDYIVGPRVPATLPQPERRLFHLLGALMGVAGLLLLVSIFLPYWGLRLEAPQYPDDLSVTVYLNRVTGDVEEIDGLNHYIGMRPLSNAAELERTLSAIIVAGIALLVVAAFFIHSPVAVFLIVPALLFPVVFLGDMYFWLWNFGTNLDARAPLSNAVKPFVPPILGVGIVGQFKTVAYVYSGFYCSVAASLLLVVGLFLHRRVFRPLYAKVVREVP